jgi:hypothetical protein
MNSCFSSFRVSSILYHGNTDMSHTLLKWLESVQIVQSMFRMFSNVQTLLNQCSECLVMFRLCSVNVQNVQNLVRIYFKVQNVQNLFSQCKECSAMFRLFSECSVMFRLCSEYLAQKTGLFRISWLCNAFRNTVLPIRFNEWILPMFTYYSLQQYAKQHIAQFEVCFQ